MSTVTNILRGWYALNECILASRIYERILNTHFIFDGIITEVALKCILAHHLISMAP